MTISSFKLATIAAVLSAFTAAHAQAPIQQFSQIVGTWVGTAQFKSGGDALKNPVDASVKVSTAVKGHYIEFVRVLYMPAGADESLSLLTYDPTAKLWEMWSYNQHSPGAHLLTGVFDEKHDLTLTSPAIQEIGTTVAYREIFHIDSPDKFTLEYDIRLKDKWQEDFTVNFARKEDTKK